MHAPTYMSDPHWSTPPDLAICFTGQEEEFRDKKKMDALYLHVKSEVEDALQYLQVSVTASSLAWFPIPYFQFEFFFCICYQSLLKFMFNKLSM